MATQKKKSVLPIGAAVSQPVTGAPADLVERFLRSVVKGREYARRYREQTISILGKYTRRKREFNEFDYDSTLLVLTAEAWVGDEILKEDVAMRAELVGVLSPSNYMKFFNYGIVKKIYRDLKSSGWKPAPWQFSTAKHDPISSCQMFDFVDEVRKPCRCDAEPRLRQTM